MFARLLFAAVAISAFSNVAVAEVLECNLKTNASSGGWVTEIYYFEYEPNGTKARVYDGVIEHFEGAPVGADITENTAKKMVFNWSLATNNQGQTIRMRFRAAYFKTNKSVNIRAFPDSAYVGEFTGEGKCKIVQ